MAIRRARQRIINSDNLTEDWDPQDEKKIVTVTDQLRRRLRYSIASAKRPAAFFLIVLFIVAISVLLIQLHALLRERQGPLDHVTTSLREPYYGMFCPAFSSSNHDPVGNSTNEYSQSASWDCTKRMPAFPRIYMIGARNGNEDTFHSWKKMLQEHGGRNESRDTPHFERINTLQISNRYALGGGTLRASPGAIPADRSNQTQLTCRKVKWEHRLFAVYQALFSHLLSTYPNDPGFVIVEDDAVLKNARAFESEVCGAHQQRLQFYSLYRSPLQRRSCLYVHGTVAFYIRRPLMETIASERRRGSFCRFPIDMYILRMGPWYATQREIVGHQGMGRIGST